MAETSWPKPLKLSELAHGPVTRRLAADDAKRQSVARELGLDGLDRLEAELDVEPWLDGAKVRGRLDAVVRQTCGVTLEPLESEIDQAFELTLLPQGSPNAPTGAEEVIDPDAEDPPDLIDTDQIDLGAIVVEQLALEIDPFPRKPGAVFDAGPQEQPPSPFAVLKDFKPRGS